MSPTKLLLGQIIVVFTIVLFGVWTATQWCAAMLGYQRELGQAWFELAGVSIYRPWQLIAWWYHFDAYAPEVFDKAGTLAGASGFMGCAAAIAGSLWRARQSRHVTTYGSARWARLRDIRKAGLLRVAVNPSPELASALNRYAVFCRTTYVNEETVTDLLPAIVGAFLKSDKAFLRWCRDAAE